MERARPAVTTKCPTPEILCCSLGEMCRRSVPLPAHAPASAALNAALVRPDVCRPGPAKETQVEARCVSARAAPTAPSPARLATTRHPQPNNALRRQTLHARCPVCPRPQTAARHRGHPGSHDGRGHQCLCQSCPDVDQFARTANLRHHRSISRPAFSAARSLVASCFFPVVRM
ncbi:hypothetical protein P153DRAFT_21844 [Dothidotthia symphoricarpi CBS 119687]|uniref:Uncharacterized protein n=1 Tax=Dothidotthia symphoricarpi CBS 119687 TaxID=1392245 RepID=A0A6A6ACM2_9PLEO|nr:uncharacterized protein P153DRAFT_21844 [Dothidotthia symphoricarpi CBS 119687]KAF2129569.1 hypothetical protein P153DRAFT_21844 [Dothidotthia symphoricarpi CBS 119687]